MALTTEEHNWLYGNTLRSIQAQANVKSALALSAPEFVEGLYEQYLGRPSDSVGKAAWVKAVVDGVDPAVVESSFVNSPESKRRAPVSV